jgi:hypothetical protein
MQVAIIREGIPTLPPGKEFRIHFERMPDRFTSDLPRSYTATVHFSSNRRVEQPLIYRLDLDVYFGTRHLTIYGIHHIAKSVDEMHRTLKRWTTHLDGLKVYAVDEASYQEELAGTYRSLESEVESVGTSQSDFDSAITTGAVMEDNAKDRAKVTTPSALPPSPHPERRTVSSSKRCSTTTARPCRHATLF